MAAEYTLPQVFRNRGETKRKIARLLLDDYAANHPEIDLELVLNPQISGWSRKKINEFKDNIISQAEKIESSVYNYFKPLQEVRKNEKPGVTTALIEPPRGEAPTRTQPRTEIARPGGNGDRIKAAYDALKAERGVENIEIADIRDRAGASQAEIEAYLKR